MAKQHAQESLTDVLGDDRSLWSMFQRRGSYAKQTDLMGDMYRNDTDIRLISKVQAGGDDFSDLMLLDNFNFTRVGSASSASSYQTTAFQGAVPGQVETSHLNSQ